MLMGEAPVLRVEQLTKVFGEGATAVRAVDGVDLQVQAGELVLIMGPSGSGKTTLLTMVGGLLRPTSGRIWIDGLELTVLPERELPRVRRERVGFIFQTFNLLETLSALENVEMALNVAGRTGPQARERARALLEERGLAHRLSFPPIKLSGGEKQRVSIARALANTPRLLLADEPTANLDSKHGHDVMLLLRQIAKEESRCVLVVSHDHRIREVADRVLWLEDGRFKDLGRLATDPVCGMLVEVQTSPWLDHGGARYYFCSRGCRAEFTEDPSAILAKATH